MVDQIIAGTITADQALVVPPTVQHVYRGCPCGEVNCCRENDHLFWPNSNALEIDMSNEEHIVRGSE